MIFTLSFSRWWFQSLHFRRNLTVAYFFQIGLVQPPTIPIMTAGLSTLVFLWSTKIRWTFWVNWEMCWTNFFRNHHGGTKFDGFCVIRGKASRWDTFFLKQIDLRELNLVLEKLFFCPWDSFPTIKKNGCFSTPTIAYNKGFSFNHRNWEKPLSLRIQVCPRKGIQPRILF